MSETEEVYKLILHMSNNISRIAVATETTALCIASLNELISKIEHNSATLRVTNGWLGHMSKQIEQLDLAKTKDTIVMVHEFLSEAKKQRRKRKQ